MTDQANNVSRLERIAKTMEAGHWPSSAKVVREAAQEIERLRAERDEARREWCIQSIEAQEGNRASVRILAKKLAEDIRGWDCFKENTDG